MKAAACNVTLDLRANPTSLLEVLNVRRIPSRILNEEKLCKRVFGLASEVERGLD